MRRSPNSLFLLRSVRQKAKEFSIKYTPRLLTLVLVTLVAAIFCLRLTIIFQSSDDRLGRNPPQDCEQLLNLERLVQKLIRAVCETGHSHFFVYCRTDDQHL